ncbi:unnamed protein product [Nezara viridula]|uniref:Uncharacterized protein n=1 Tax=Nezara viridula TaxID=85310 RepID=A0A9P0EC44_NEZVI|nr:unnamed protein product [Nezara viridula]
MEVDMLLEKAMRASPLGVADGSFIDSPGGAYVSPAGRCKACDVDPGKGTCRMTHYRRGSRSRKINTAVPLNRLAPSSHHSSAQGCQHISISSVSSSMLLLP